MGFVIDLAKIVKDFLRHRGIETEGFCRASDDEVPFVDFPRLDDLTHGKGDFFLGDILDFIPADASELNFRGPNRRRGSPRWFGEPQSD